MSDKEMFIIYYAGLLSMQYHPRNFENFHDVDLHFLSGVALAACELTNKLFKDDE